MESLIVRCGRQLYSLRYNLSSHSLLFVENWSIDISKERFGRMEIWKGIRNFPNYSASSEGRIMNIKTQRILTPVVDENGYSKVTLRKNGKQYSVRVHRLIADTFLGESDNLDVLTKDLDISNFRPDNLECCTRSETISRAYERGSKTSSNRTRILVIETGDIFESISDCARELGCDKSSISKFLSGRLNDVKGYHFEIV